MSGEFATDTERKIEVVDLHKSVSSFNAFASDDETRAYEELIAVFSAQGYTFIRLPRLASNSLARPVLVRAASCSVPRSWRSELRGLSTGRDGLRVAQYDEGHLGVLLTSTRQRFGIELFGGAERDGFVSFPDHSEFAPDNLVAGGGVVGAALVVPGVNVGGLSFLGCFVPFPVPLYTVDEGPLGGANYSEIRRYLASRFSEDVWLESSLDRLDRFRFSKAFPSMHMRPATMPKVPLIAERVLDIATNAPNPRWKF